MLSLSIAKWDYRNGLSQEGLFLGDIVSDPLRYVSHLISCCYFSLLQMIHDFVKYASYALTLIALNTKKDSNVINQYLGEFCESMQFIQSGSHGISGTR